MSSCTAVHLNAFNYSPQTAAKSRDTDGGQQGRENGEMLKIAADVT